MRERDALRTAEALHDMRPLDELTAEEWAQEFRRCVIFAVIAFVGVYALLSL